MQISKLFLSSVLLLSLVSASAFIMPKSIVLKSMSNNNINHLTIRKGFNNNNQNNNQNKSKIIKFNFKINDINDNFLISTIIMCIYFYVNNWLINLFFNFYISIISNQ